MAKSDGKKGSSSKSGKVPPPAVQPRAPKRTLTDTGTHEQPPSDDQIDAFADFVRVLGETGLRKDALKESGLSREAIRDRMENDPAFSRSVSQAWELAIDAAEDEAFRRAVVGWDEAVFDKQGLPAGEVHRYDGSLLQFLLKGNRGKYRGEDAGRSRGISDETRREIRSVFSEAEALP